MYNRYIRNDSGTYSRIPQEEPQTPPRNRQETPPKPPPPPPPGGEHKDGLTAFLRHFLDQFHLDHVDTDRKSVV